MTAHHTLNQKQQQQPWMLIHGWEEKDTWKYMAKWGIYGMRQSANKFRDEQLVIKDAITDEVFKMRKLKGQFVEWN